MKLSEILKLRGINVKKVKLIRHTTNRQNIKELIDSGNFELYQSYQKSDILKNISNIISFTNMDGTKSLLYGFYNVSKSYEVESLPKELIKIKESEDWGDGPYYKYDLKRTNELNDLEGRLVIDWGKSTVSWHQTKLDKEVIEILPKGFVKQFPGYENVILSFEELSSIINNPDSNKQWKNMLSNVYGIYIILDKSNGKQYIGSAYGKQGIWGRWSEYVQSKHGNNKNLIDLLQNHPHRYKDFQFSILKVLPNCLTSNEVVQIEGTTKEKLGTIKFGLNAN